MARKNTFTLLNDGDIIDLRPNTTTKDVQTTVNGSDLTQTVYIHAGVSGVDLTATMERADFAFKASDVSFRMNPEGKLEVIYNNSLIASIANNSASGTDLAFTDGKINVKAAQDDAGNLVFQLKGDSSAAPQNIPADGSQASLSIPLDSSSKSALADGGDTPKPPTVTTIDLDKGESIPTDGSPYNLIGKVEKLAELTTAQVNGATNITAKDDVDMLTSDSAIIKAVLALATNITVEDAVENLALADLSGLANPKLVVKSVPTDGKVTLTEPVKVDYVDSANEKLEAFLARTDVDYTTYKLEKPESLTLGDYSITDTAAAIAAAPAKVLAGAIPDGVTVEDTMSGWAANLAVADNANVDNLTVADSLTHILSGGKLVVDGLINNSATFIADDTPTNGVVSANASVLESFVNKEITFENNDDVQTVELTATKAVGTASSSLDLGKIFNDEVSAKINFTGSIAKDVVTADAGSTINGGGGQDEITLVASSSETVVLGSDAWNPAIVKSGSINEDNMVEIKTFGTEDKIDFGGIFADFTKGTKVSQAFSTTSTASLTKNTFSFVEDTGTDVQDFKDGTFKLASQGDAAIIAIKGASNTANIYYIQELGTDGVINKTNDIVIKLATIQMESSSDFAESNFAEPLTPSRRGGTLPAPERNHTPASPFSRRWGTAGVFAVWRLGGIKKAPARGA